MQNFRTFANKKRAYEVIKNSQIAEKQRVILYEIK